MGAASVPGFAQSPASAPTQSSETPTSSSAAPSAASASTATASASPTTSAADPTAANGVPSPDLIKKARREGYKPEKQKTGETLFCATDPSETGTRLGSRDKKCIRPDQIDAVIAARQDQRNELNRTRACAGCSSH
jgi:hypothetical protein